MGDPRKCISAMGGHIKWQLITKPNNSTFLCVIFTGEDYEFGYWDESVCCWDCPEKGWVEDSEVLGWFELPLPPEPNQEALKGV